MSNGHEKFLIKANKDRINYKDVITMVSDTQARQLKVMYRNISNSFQVSSLFYAPLPPGGNDA